MLDGDASKVDIKSQSLSNQGCLSTVEDLLYTARMGVAIPF